MKSILWVMDGRVRILQARPWLSKSKGSFMNPENHLARLERQEIQGGSLLHGVGLNLALIWLIYGLKRGNFWRWMR